MASTPDEQNGGVQYVLSREAAEALGISSYGGGCIPAGSIKIDLLGVQGNRGMVQIKARGIVEQTPDWAAKISEELPALKSLIENGLQMSGQMIFAPNEGEGKWRLSGLSPGYPDISYDTLPARLIPLMPHTVAAFPPKPVKAPALVEPATNPSAQGNASLGTPLPQQWLRQQHPVRCSLSHPGQSRHRPRVNQRYIQPTVHQYM